MKPVTYYIQNSQIDKLVERFGADLDSLDREQKLQLRLALTTFIWGQNQMGDNYSLENGWQDSFNEIIEQDDELCEVFTILGDLSVETAEGLLEALQVQCRYGNARAKTPTEHAIDTLLKHGVCEELAKTAAEILTAVDSTRERTSQEQGIINQVNQIINQAGTKNK